ncbi:MAG: phosphotransferase [Armatimonadota bacterium]
MNELDCLTDFQQRLVLSLFPAGAKIAKAEWMQWMRPCPVAVDVSVPGFQILYRVVLRRSRNKGGVEREALVLPELASLGLPVPRLLAGPSTDPSTSESVTVLNFLPGFRLYDLALHPEMPRVRSCNRAVEAIQMMHDTTDAVLANPIASLLPRRTLLEEWAEQRDRSGDWGNRHEYTETLRQVESACRVASQTPLVFSNGDYQPGNFLTDGHIVTGLLDFEKAGFFDPLLNLARYPVYGIEPLTSAGIATDFCIVNGFTSADFALRVVVFGLRTLRTKFVPDNSQAVPRTEMRDNLLDLIRQSLEEVRN